MSSSNLYTRKQLRGNIHPSHEHRRHRIPPKQNNNISHQQHILQEEQFCGQCIWKTNTLCEDRVQFIVKRGILTIDEARQSLFDRKASCRSISGEPEILEEELPPIVEEEEEEEPAVVVEVQKVSEEEGKTVQQEIVPQVKELQEESTSTQEEEETPPIEAFCSSCPWKTGQFDCDERMQYLVDFYNLSENDAKLGLLEQGHCINTDYDPDAVVSRPQPNKVIEFCGECIWKESEFTCDLKAELMAENPYRDPPITLQEAKIEILNDCNKQDGLPWEDEGSIKQEEGNIVEEQQSLSGGAVAGIVISLLVLALFIVVGVLFKRGSRESKEDEVTNPEDPPAKQPNDDENQQGNVPPVECFKEKAEEKDTTADDNESDDMLMVSEGAAAAVMAAGMSLSSRVTPPTEAEEEFPSSPSNSNRSNSYRSGSASGTAHGSGCKTPASIPTDEALPTRSSREPWDGSPPKSTKEPKQEAESSPPLVRESQTPSPEPEVEIWIQCKHDDDNTVAHSVLTYETDWTVSSVDTPRGLTLSKYRSPDPQGDTKNVDSRASKGLYTMNEDNSSREGSSRSSRDPSGSKGSRLLEQAKKAAILEEETKNRSVLKGEGREKDTMMIQKLAMNDDSVSLAEEMALQMMAEIDDEDGESEDEEGSIYGDVSVSVDMKDDKLKAHRDLTMDELATLHELLEEELNIVSDDDYEDAENLLDFTLDMVDSGESIGHITEELKYMGMSVCDEDAAHKLGVCLTKYFINLKKRD